MPYRIDLDTILDGRRSDVGTSTTTKRVTCHICELRGYAATLRKNSADTAHRSMGTTSSCGGKAGNAVRTYLHPF